MYYNQKRRKRKKAEECIKFVVNSCNEHGLLAEQVDNKTMTSNWVIGLGWSHAMFVFVTKKKYLKSDKGGKNGKGQNNICM